MTTIDLIKEGVLLGLLLAVMVGPIMITIIQSCLKGGKVAGFEVGIGIWISDFLILGLVYFGIIKLSEVAFGFSFGSILKYLGALIFMTIGLFVAIRKYKDFRVAETKTSLVEHGKYMLKGFLVNTINPFTFIFWISVVGSRIIPRNLTDSQSYIFLGSILFMIILSDSLKVLLSDWIRTQMKFKYLVYTQRIAGVCLFLFGIYLLFFELPL